MIRRPPRSTLSSSSAASDVYKRQVRGQLLFAMGASLGCVDGLKSCCATMHLSKKPAADDDDMPSPEPRPEEHVYTNNRSSSPDPFVLAPAPAPLPAPSESGASTPVLVDGAPVRDKRVYAAPDPRGHRQKHSDDPADPSSVVLTEAPNPFTYSESAASHQSLSVWKDQSGVAEPCDPEEEEVKEAGAPEEDEGEPGQPSPEPVGAVQPKSPRASGPRTRVNTLERAAQENMLAETADGVFASYDADGNGLIDSKELQKLITHCIKRLPCTSPDEEAQRDELMSEFAEGSREYCLSALKLIKDDAQLDIVTFKEWLHHPDNFLFYPFKKFRVMLWAFDLFRDFDLDGDGMITLSEFNQAIAKIKFEIETGSDDEELSILAELNFEDLDWEKEDGELSTRELVMVLLGMWERLYTALFAQADNFF
eukprot:TRINITY_DN3580_c0_g2_i4.p1 TRINITY_DN3580_c0_g2~~TRINITY_DN3580_c0_g2_i4.p1  ORF type:complete len:424 (-),score=115.63 TRINITY_DN3580_c0_g2_i4:451-1722(-)